MPIKMADHSNNQTDSSSRAHTSQAIVLKSPKSRRNYLGRSAALRSSPDRPDHWLNGFNRAAELSKP